MEQTGLNEGVKCGKCHNNEDDELVCVEWVKVNATDLQEAGEVNQEIDSRDTEMYIGMHDL